MSEVTVEELIERLQEMEPGSIVRLATQPSYPFENTVGEIAQGETVSEDGDPVKVIWIGEGEQIGYLNSETRDDLGW